MKKIWNFIINNPFIHPVIWAIFPVVSLYTHNIDESWPQILITPIVYSLIFAGISWIVFFVIFRNRYKTGVMLSIWLILFFSYGHINLNLSSGIVAKILPISINIFLLGTTFIIIVAAGLFLLRQKGKVIVWVNLLNFVGVVLLSLSLYQIIPHEIKRIMALQRLEEYRLQHRENISVKNKNSNTYPDIYYFIFDRYGRQDILEKYFDYENTEFLQSLKDKKFYVDTKSNANYPTTFLSLASSLNMQHLTYLSDILGTNYSDKSVVYRTLLENNEVGRFLKEQGYQYIQFGSVWKGFMQSSAANKNYNLFINFDEFLYYIYENTLLNAVWGKVSGQQLYIGELRLKKSIENQNYQLVKIKEIIPTDSPKFVFAHFLLPHPPYLFSDDCTDLDFEVIRTRSLEAGYKSQTNCANKIMTKFYSDITKNSKRPVVIIYQSDEGPYLPSAYFPNEKYPEKNINTSYKIHSGILNAVYITPKTEDTADLDKQFQEGRTPVNTFRLLFNYYFGTGYKLLENTTYVYKEEKKPFVFHEITDILQ